MTRILTIFALAICLCSSAMAGLTLHDQVGVDFERVSSGRSVTLSLNGYYQGLTTTAGSMTLIVDGVTYEGFCVDPYQSATYNLVNNYLVETLPEVSNLGTAKAQVLANVLSQWTDGMTATQYAGMQLAIWEIVAEDLGNYNLFAGDFTVDVSSDVLAAAMAYLGATQSDQGDISDYMALTHGDYQDFLVHVSAVPAPGAIFLGGIGGLLVAKIRRRRMA